MKSTGSAKAASAKPASAKVASAKPAEPARLAMLQFLAWIADRPRIYPEARDGWHSCPPLSAWEHAIIDGLVRIENGGNRAATLTPRRQAALEEVRAHSHSVAALPTNQNCRPLSARRLARC